MHTIRRLMLAAVLAVAATLMLPATAQANETATFCFDVDADSSGAAGWDCHQILLHRQDPQLPDVCPADCGLAIDFDDDHIDSEVRAEYLGLFATGFSTLGASEVADDAGDAEDLRLEATESFLASAAALGDEQVSWERTGWVDQTTGEFFEDDFAPIESAADFMSRGLSILQDEPDERDVRLGVQVIESGYGCFVMAFRFDR